MKIVQVNSVCGGSTGKIAHCIAANLDEKGIENHILYAYGKRRALHDIPFSDAKEIKLNALKSRILGNYGFNSVAASKRLIGKLEELKPDIIHMHVTHAHDMNMETVCAYLSDKKVIWTMHDCWLYTGYCPYYTHAGCDHWKTECHECRLKRSFSWFFDRSTSNFNRKKNALNTFRDLTIVTPSEWLKKEAEQSFLKKHPILTINNGIDLTLFRILPQIREQRDSEKKMILCVGLPFGERKGIQDVLELSKILPKEYRIVIIGAEKGKYPENIIAVPHTENQQELVEYYNRAYVLLNPTHEDNFPTVNLEAMACGLPVITYNTGGSPESIDPDTGIIVRENDIQGLKDAVMNISLNPEKCRERAEALYSDKRMAEAYLKLYMQKNAQ